MSDQTHVYGNCALGGGAAVHNSPVKITMNFYTRGADEQTIARIVGQIREGLGLANPALQLSVIGDPSRERS